jgi:hypothetical protein
LRFATETVLDERPSASLKFVGPFKSVTVKIWTAASEPDRILGDESLEVGL